MTPVATTIQFEVDVSEEIDMECKYRNDVTFASHSLAVNAIVVLTVIPSFSLHGVEGHGEMSTKFTMPELPVNITV